MNLGLFLSIGESFKDLENKGQLKRLVKYNIRKYSKNFDKVYIFTYRNESGFDLPKNCILIPNKKNLNRFIYSVLMPFVNIKSIRDCNVLRGLQITGGIPAILAKIVFGKNFVINYGYDYSKLAKIERKVAQSVLYKLIESPILLLSNKVIVTSKEIKEKLRKRYGSKKLVLIPNGVDIKLFKPIIKKTNSNKLTIIYIGRLEEQKNLNNLLNALKDMQDIRVIFVGNGSLRNKLLEVAKNKNIELEIEDSVDYEKLPKILSTAHIFALPSLIEGNPKILLEAMSCQKAVLGSNVEGIRELITNGKNGLICSTSVKSIKSGLVKLQNAKLRKKLGSEARKFVSNNYEINKLLSVEIDLLLKIAR